MTGYRNNYLHIMKNENYIEIMHIKYTHRHTDTHTLLLLHY